MADQQYISFDGFSGDVRIFSAEYTITDGISPGVGTLTVAPQGDITNITGNLTLGIGSNAVTIQNVTILDPQMLADTGGQNVILQFADPRVWWGNGELNGIYNVLLPDDTLDLRTEKTPRQLATLCLQKMPYVASFDVSAMPNDIRPAMTWIGAVPAQELAKLCDLVNCRVCYWIDGTVTICVAGQGMLLDASLPSESRSIAMTIKPTPDKIKLLATEDLYQVRLPLEAVALDSDGKWDLDDDVSYKPAGGWEKEDPNFLMGVAESEVILPDGSKTSLRELAQATHWRCYRIQEDLTDAFAGTGISTPSGSLAFHREHVLPLVSSSLVETYIEATDGRKIPKDAFVTGVFYYPGRPDCKQSQPGTRLEGTPNVSGSQIGFSINAHLGIVTVSQPVYKIDGGILSAAELYLHIAVRLKDPVTRIPLRYTKERTLNSPTTGAGTNVIHRDDIQRTFIFNYKQAGGGTNIIFDFLTINTADCDKAAKYYLDAEQAAYDRPQSAQDQIPGIVTGYRIDGAVKQISWSIDVNSGATTQVSRGTQHDPSVPSYAERRRREKAHQLSDASMKMLVKQILNKKNEVTV